MTIHPKAKTTPVLFLVALLLTLAGCSAAVRIEWSTETEIDTAGFNLYRGESPDGPFETKVNDQLIPPSTDPMTGGKYSFLDKTARPGVTYYYQLQEVEQNGGVNTHGPIAVRANGLDWRQALIFIPLALIVLYLWLRGSRPRAVDGATPDRQEGARP